VAKAKGRLSTTTGGMIKGTMKYIAPEQARGNAEPRSDIFALGAVLFETISGEPFRSSTSWTTITRGNQALPRLSQRRDDVSESLEDLMLRCLFPEPHPRPADAATLRAALTEELFAFEVRLGRRTDTHDRLRDLLARHGWQKARPPGPDQAMIDTAAEAPPSGRRADVEAAQSSPARLRESEPRQADARDTSPLEEETTQVSPPRGDAPEEEEEVEEAAFRPPWDTVHTRSMLPVRRKGPLLVGAVLVVLVGVVLFLLVSQPPAVVPEAPVAGEAPVATGASERADAAVATAKDAGDRLLHAARQRDLRPEASASALAEPDTGLVSLATIDATAAPLRQRASAGASGPKKRGPTKHLTSPTPAKRAPAPRQRGGILFINATPRAKVYVDGTYRGMTPLAGLRLSAGDHRIWLMNDEQRLSHRFVVQIKQGQTIRREIKLRRAGEPR